MTKRRRDQFERQTVVDAQTIAALTGATEVPPQGIVQTLDLPPKSSWGNLWRLPE